MQRVKKCKEGHIKTVSTGHECHSYEKRNRMQREELAASNESSAQQDIDVLNCK